MLQQVQIQFKSSKTENIQKHKTGIISEMSKIKNIIILSCLITCVASHFIPTASYTTTRKMLAKPKFIGPQLPSIATTTSSLDLQENSKMDKSWSFTGLLQDIFKSFIDSLKNPSGPNVNPYNRCVWKICSKPMKGSKAVSYSDRKVFYSEQEMLDDMLNVHAKFFPV